MDYGCSQGSEQSDKSHEGFETVLSAAPQIRVATSMPNRLQLQKKRLEGEEMWEDWCTQITYQGANLQQMLTFIYASLLLPCSITFSQQQAYEVG